MVFCAASLLLLGACGGSAPPRVKDPLLAAQDRSQPPGQRVQAAREAIARAGDDNVAQQTVWRELSKVAWSTTDDDAVRTGALAALLAVPGEGAKNTLRADLVAALGDERDPSMLRAGAELAAREGWTDAVPALTLAIARSSLLASDGRQDAGPRAIPTATLRFGSARDEAAVRDNVQSGTVLSSATQRDASLAAKRALSELLSREGGGGVDTLWQFVVAPVLTASDAQVARPDAKLPANAVQPNLAQAKSGVDNEFGLQTPAAAIEGVKATTKQLAAARQTERLRIAAYDVLAKQQAAHNGAENQMEEGDVWAKVNLVSLLQGADAQSPVVKRLRVAQDALGALPATGEEFRQLLSMPIETESAQQWWGQVKQARNANRYGDSVAVGMAECVRWSQERMRPSTGEVGMTPPLAFSAAIANPTQDQLPAVHSAACRMLKEVLSRASVRDGLRQQLELDRGDRRAVYGGWLIERAAAHEPSNVVARICSPRPSERQGDYSFAPTDDMLTQSGMALAWYRLNAQRENNGDRSDPDDRDRWIVAQARRPYVIITSISAQRAKAVYVWSGGIVDLGTLELVANGKSSES